MVTRLEIRPKYREVNKEDSEDKSSCHHYWVIESPNGSSSRGVCKFCNAEKVFANSVDRYVIRKTPHPRQPVIHMPPVAIV